MGWFVAWPDRDYNPPIQCWVIRLAATDVSRRNIACASKPLVEVLTLTRVDLPRRISEQQVLHSFWHRRSLARFVDKASFTTSCSRPCHRSGGSGWHVSSTMGSVPTVLPLIAYFPSGEVLDLRFQQRPLNAILAVCLVVWFVAHQRQPDNDVRSQRDTGCVRCDRLIYSKSVVRQLVVPFRHPRARCSAGPSMLRGIGRRGSGVRSGIDLALDLCRFLRPAW